MCGICGIISSDALSGKEVNSVRQMSEALIHRGPDSDGEFIDRFIALAVRRLSIIDVTGGNQPLYNENDSLVLVANAEIYNFIELREGLISKGHFFKTGSDCETILHLYEEHGADCVNHLRGMFAFALWDKKARSLFLARDRMGEKPLYLYRGKHQLVFASELKSLLQSGMISFTLNSSAVDLYFHYQYVPEPLTPIKEISKLEAGHTLIIKLEPWQEKTTCYWRMENAPALEGDPAELIGAELDTISKLVIRSDVPVGVALSGGLDSSAVTALAHKKYPGILHAFTVGYPDHPPFDERADAKELADYLEIPFHEIELATQDMVSSFPELVYWRDDPIADISGYGYHTVMKLAKEHGVPVMLQGQAGDELFWGYPWVREAVRECLIKDSVTRTGWPVLLKHIVPGLSSAFPCNGLRDWVNSAAGLRKVWQRIHRCIFEPSERMAFYDLTPDFQTASSGIHRLYTPAFLERLIEPGPFSLFTSPLPWPKIDVYLTSLISRSYLLGNGIVQADRLSMASSVELRLPLVDYKLVETVIGLRKNQSDYHLPPKAWLKTALKGHLPDWVLNRPKRGFQPPSRAWHKALFEAYGSLLEDGYLVKAEVLKPEGAHNLASGPFPPMAIVPLSFKALVLEVWCRKFSSLASPSLQ